MVISDSRSLACVRGQVPRETFTPAMLQPVLDVPAYREKRRAVAHCRDEQPLFVTLPEDVRSDVEALLKAFDDVRILIKAGLSVQAACREVLPIYKNRWGLKTFRANYDSWRKAKDWTVLVNCAKAGAAWQERDDNLPAAFIDFCASEIGSYQREDARKEALRELKRKWRSGRDLHGNPAPISGYGRWQDWFQEGGYKLLGLPRRPLPEEAPIPPGWSYSNIMRQIKARNALPKAVHKMLQQGSSAARAYIPRVRSTRHWLRFMEQVQFDDVKVDWRILNTATKQPEDLWLLIAHDVATTVLLGFGMRSATVREDGTQQHLSLKDMKQLCGWLLERYGLPPYVMQWVLENGTATLSEGDAIALNEMLNGRLNIRFTAMIGGVSARGYRERSIGNSAGKASLESLNRLTHIIGANLPGQVGPHYGKRPQDAAAREREAVEILKLAQMLPEHLRGDARYPLLTKEQAREQLFRIFGIRNHRDDHNLEGFADVVEWYDPATGRICPQNTIPDLLPPGARIFKRRETPVERAARLVKAACEEEGQGWTQVSPDIITAFYEHTRRHERIEKDGSIKITIDGRVVEYVRPNPTDHHPLLVPDRYVLAHSHPDDPAYLHLSSGDGKMLGTWLRRQLAHDEDSLQAAIRYSQAALTAVKEHAERLAAPDRERDAAMRAHNQALLDANTFVALTETASTGSGPQATSAVATALTSVPKARKRVQDSAAAQAFLASEINK